VERVPTPTNTNISICIDFAAIEKKDEFMLLKKSENWPQGIILK